MPSWYINSIEISGGFLAGLTIALPKGLTCIIGPRGSGKTTLAESLRYAMAGSTGISKAGQKAMATEVAPSVITVNTSSDGDTPGYIITRSSKNVVSLSTIGGIGVSAVDLDRRTFLPLDGYSSIEIEELADETDGEKRRALIDELKWDDIQSANYRIADIRRQLDANADQIKRTRDSISDIGERIEEVGDARSRLAALPISDIDSEAVDLLAAVEQKKCNERERVSIQARLDTLKQLQSDFTSLSDRLSTAAARPLATEGSSNASILEKIDQRAGKVAKDVSIDISKIIEMLHAEEALVQLTSTELAAAHAEHSQLCAQLEAKNIAASQAIQDRAKAEQAVASLTELESEYRYSQDLLQSTLESRKSLRAKYLEGKDGISAIREQVVQKLQSEIGETVRVQLSRSADSGRYQQFLAEGLRGARVRNQEDIVNGLLRLRPEQLAQIILERDYAELEILLELGAERSRKVLDAFVDNVNPFELELVPIEDRVLIELNIGSFENPIYKEASGLSRGQKCTALLPLLLARRSTPLLIDQPEDNLDNHFIFETVVDAVHRLKSQRQMIFITHNANIPVLAEADLVVVLNSDGRTGSIEKSGTLDDCKQHIMDLLEGGSEAFEKRRQRYAR
ncbi:MAG TPA: AAA family ATPase [Capsulimonadaceae bacterium]